LDSLFTTDFDTATFSTILINAVRPLVGNLVWYNVVAS
jgi:hypothetical protein